MDFTPEQPTIFDASTGQQVKVKPEDIANQILAGKIGFKPGDKIPLVDLNGEAYTVAAEDLPNALKQGFKYEPIENQSKRAQKEFYSQPIEQIKALAEGLARGVTLGLSDPILANTISTDEAMLGREEANPGISMGANLAGTILPALLSGGTSEAASGAAIAARTALRYTPAAIVSRAGLATTKAVGSLMAKEGAEVAAQSIIKNAIPRLAGSVVEGSFYGLGGAVSEVSLGDHENIAEKLLGGAGVGALLGGAFGATFESLGAGKDLAEPYVKKALDKIGGSSDDAIAKILNIGLNIPEKVSKDYISNPSKFRNAPEFNEMAEKLSNHIDDLMNNKAAAEDTLSIAKQQLLESKYTAKDAEGITKEAFKDALAQKKYEIDSLSASKYHSDVIDGLEKLRTEVTNGSAAAYDHLAASGKTLKDPTEQIFSPYIAQLEGSTSELDKVALQKLLRKKELIQSKIGVPEDVIGIKYGNAPKAKPGIPATQMKSILQDLDADGYAAGVNYGAGAANYDKAYAGVLKGIRHDYDTFLKDAKTGVKGYAELMEPVAENTKLLGKFKSVDRPETMFTYLKNIEGTEKGQEFGFNYLKQLQEKVGGSFASDIEKVIKQKSVLDDPKIWKKAFTSMDEYKEWKAAQDHLAKLNSPQAKDLYNIASSQSPEQNSVIIANQALKALKENLSEFKGITPENAEKTLLNALTGKNPQLATKINKILGDDVVNTLRVNKMLTGGITNGSRNVNLWAALIGGVTGLALGKDDMGTGALLGAMAGAGGGGAVDKYGGQAAKIILDGYVKLFKMEAMSNQASQAIATGIKSFVSKGSEVAKNAIVPGSIGYLNKGAIDKEGYDRSKKSRVSAYNKRLEEASNAMANPSIVTDNIAQNISSISKIAPNISNSLTQKSLNALNYIYQMAPKDPYTGNVVSPNLKHWQPSDRELSKFERIMKATDNPMSILDDMKKGILTTDSIDAVKNVYPKIYSEITENIIDNLSQIKEELPYQKRLQLSIFFGIPTDMATNPSMLRSLQQNHMAAQEEQRQKSIDVSQMRKNNNAMTDTERTMRRV